MDRYELITKEGMESYCKGEEDRKDSVNDDLESLFEDFRLGKEPDDWIFTYFFAEIDGGRNGIG